MKTVLLAAVSVVALASSSFAQPATQSPTGNLEKLSSFQSTGTAEPRPVAQDGRSADAIRKNLEKI
jgi:opacity protein-like surface antigen